MATATPKPRLFVVRHGETEWSRAGRHTGRTDLPLTAVGEAAAAALAPALADVAVGAVWTSPLTRARRTAALAGFPDAVVVPELAEWDYGDYEGLTRAQIVERRHGQSWDPFEHGFPGGETLAGLAARVDRVVARVRARSDDVLVFAHGHSLKVLAARWLGFEPALARIFAIDTTTIGTLGWYHHDPAVERWNGPA